MPQKAKKTANDEMLWFEDSRLCMIVTVGEISYLWQKSKTAIMHHVYNHNFIARKTITGGEWIVLTSSVLSMWGKPVHNDLNNYYEGKRHETGHSHSASALRET